MCDTLCAPGPRGMVFAKNSDRPPGEVQVAWPFGRRASAGGTLRTQYLAIGDTGAHATFLSCPTWLWGAEHGINEHAVAIGNERVSTTHDAAAAKPALIGMDLVRLGLERARSAAEAVDVMACLLQDCGQGGIADAARQQAYDSSFLVADPTQAFVLDTAGSDFAAAPSRPARQSPTASRSTTSGPARRAASCRAKASAATATPPTTPDMQTFGWRPAAASSTRPLAVG